MAGRGKRDIGKEQFWRQMIQQWRREGGSVCDFCARHRLAEASFYGWRRTIAERDQLAARQNLSLGRRPVAAGQSNGQPSFVPLHVTHALAPSCAGPNCGRMLCQIKTVRILGCLRPVCRFAENFGDPWRESFPELKLQGLLKGRVTEFLRIWRMMVRRVWLFGRSPSHSVVAIGLTWE
jgi:hypothetical protein